ncbi:MAG: glycerol-3-phosphate 1-O-acyltransferase PlsY [Pseudomonadota bacterium]
MDFSWLLGSFAIAYLLGSIPFGLLLTRVSGAGDIRAVGSGNIGATNVLRTGRKGLAVATLLLDILKGLAAVRLTQDIYGPDVAMLSAFFVVVGHVFPIWLRFHGGKGVATTFGAFFALNWMFALAICAIWLAVFFITRFSSLSAILSICYSPVIAYLLDGYLTALLCLSLAGVILFSHRHNLLRLLSGTEMSFRKKIL